MNQPQASPRWRGAGGAASILLVASAAFCAASPSTQEQPPAASSLLPSTTAPPSLPAQLDALHAYMGRAAAYHQEATAAAHIDEPTVWTLAGRMFRSLAVVLGLIVLAAVLLRLVRRVNGPASRNSALEVLGRTSISPKSSIILVELLGRVLVIGDGEGGPRLLATVTDPEQVAQLRAGGLLPRAASAFADQFRRLSGQAAAEAEASVQAYDRMRASLRGSAEP